MNEWMSFIARYVYTYEECYMWQKLHSATEQDTDNKKNNMQIYKTGNVQKKQKHNIDNYVCTL